MSVVTNRTGGTVSQAFDPWGTVRSGGTTTRYGRHGDREDWAGTLAETVYNPLSKGGTGSDATREKTVRKAAQ